MQLHISVAGGPRGCSGCTRDEPLRSECFSARFMWGPNGQGYAYLYVPLNTSHTSEFCALVSGNGKASTCHAIIQY